MLVFKPKETDCTGWIYVYEREEDEKRLIKNKIGEILLYKVGRTIKNPESRVGQQALTNGESYTIVQSFKTNYYKFVEYAVHRMFQD